MVSSADAPRASLDQEALRTNLAWLLRLRWGALAGQLVTILGVHLGMGMELPLEPLAAVLGIELVTNVGCAVWARRNRHVHELLLAVLMGLDVVLLTALLYFTGGPFNPFSFLYVVHIALAAVVLRPRLTWSLAGLSFAAFGSLFLGHVSLAMDWNAHPEQHVLHMRMHTQGMWIAFGIAAGFIAYFVTRVTRDLARREAELERANAAAARSEKLASLATLAAGAAHELATPLSTIAVTARELERMLERAGDVAIADTRLILREIARCRSILEQLTIDAGASPGERLAELSVRGLIDEASDGLPQRERIRSAIANEMGQTRLLLPARVVTQAVRGVLQNALQASALDTSVLVRATRSASHCAISIEDFGPGMPPEVLSRAGEPFFTTKEPGKGMGLGLFLTRVVLERIGGSVAIDSGPGRGTRVELSLPVRAQTTAESSVAREVG